KLNIRTIPIPMVVRSKRENPPTCVNTIGNVRKASRHFSNSHVH
ncbi:unnamed protein product, partial [Rotaria magnacalcarata]